MPVLPINHIASDPDFRGGRPRIARANITVAFLAMYLDGSTSVAEICEVHDLTPAEVYAAWSYYADHQAEIDAQVQEAEAALDEIPHLSEQAWVRDGQRRLAAKGELEKFSQAVRHPSTD